MIITIVVINSFIIKIDFPNLNIATDISSRNTGQVEGKLRADSRNLTQVQLVWPDIVRSVWTLLKWIWNARNSLIQSF